LGTFFRSNPPRTASEGVLTTSQCRFEKRCFEVGVIIPETFSGVLRPVSIWLASSVMHGDKVTDADKAMERLASALLGCLW
jgi:hypothetical protein